MWGFVRLRREQQQTTAEAIRVNKMSQGETEDSINVLKQTESRAGKRKRERAAKGNQGEKRSPKRKRETSCVHIGRVLWQPASRKSHRSFTAGHSEDTM